MRLWKIAEPSVLVGEYVLGGVSRRFCVYPRMELVGEVYPAD